VATDGRFLISAFTDERFGTPCGHGWPLRDFRVHG
jgi:hypothetical protein